MREHSNAPGYPLTAGTALLQERIKKWAIEKLGATGDFDVLPLIGSKEFVAWLPTLLKVKSVLFPEVAYPTYNVGAILAGAIGFPVGVSPSTWPTSELAWINSPSNPTGRTHSKSEMTDVIEWSRRNASILVSDECYFEFAHSSTPHSILECTQGDNTNILAVHSLSKRSSMAGYRAAFVIGDRKLIARIREVRKHAGMMVSLPVQEAMISALSDSNHVASQRARYNLRREKLIPALERVGFTIEESGAGLYIWCTRNESDWESVDWLAQLGILATPGNFYGEKGARNIRIALTATDKAIDGAVSRLSSAEFPKVRK